ncbi:Hypothetical_protein [Hexamita inflata]|uniref:Hypothetical_protein n=1 Tax=Hexamita inflata TaxID=28002 RepID=A0AA86PCH5_9EUKA|nr:Hypothetical protein HINF_LOCUS21324 [Hexamita inflata]
MNRTVFLSSRKQSAPVQNIYGCEQLSDYLIPQNQLLRNISISELRSQLLSSNDVDQQAIIYKSIRCHDTLNIHNYDKNFIIDLEFVVKQNIANPLLFLESSLLLYSLLDHGSMSLQDFDFFYSMISLDCDPVLIMLLSSSDSEELIQFCIENFSQFNFCVLFEVLLLFQKYNVLANNPQLLIQIQELQLTQNDSSLFVEILNVGHRYILQQINLKERFEASMFWLQIIGTNNGHISAEKTMYNKITEILHCIYGETELKVFKRKYNEYGIESEKEYLTLGDVLLTKTNFSVLNQILAIPPQFPQLCACHEQFYNIMRRYTESKRYIVDLSQSLNNILLLLQSKLIRNQKNALSLINAIFEHDCKQETFLQILKILSETIHADQEVMPYYVDADFAFEIGCFIQFNISQDPVRQEIIREMCGDVLGIWSAEAESIRRVL